MNLLIPSLFFWAFAFAIPNPIPTNVHTPEKTPTQHDSASNTDVLSLQAAVDSAAKKPDTSYHDKGTKHDNKAKDHKPKQPAPAALKAEEMKPTPKLDATKAHTTKHEDAKPTAI